MPMDEKATPGQLSQADAREQLLLEYQAIFDNASVGIAYTKDRTFQRCNARFEEMFGYDPGELDGQPGSIIYTSLESYELIGDEATLPLSSGRPFESDWEFKRKDGSRFWVHLFGKAVDPQHNRRGTVWIMEDITDARATQGHLQATVRDYQAVLDNASVGILYTADRKIQRCNPKLTEMFGYSRDELIGLPGRALYRSDEEYAELGRMAGPLLSQGKPVQHELYVRRKDGSDFWVNLIGYVVDVNDPTRGAWWILEDRSDYKQAADALQRNYAELKETNRKLEEAQTQLLQSEKMASIGQLAAGVAHEINNPIGFVTSNAGTLGKYIQQFIALVNAYEQALKGVALPAAAASQIAAARQTADIEFLREDIGTLLTETQEGLQRVRRIVQDLRDFSHVDDTGWQPADLNAGIHSTLNVVWNELKFKAKVKLELGTLPEVRCNPAQINQVLMNLLVNAAHAIENTGHITVRSGAEGDWAWLEVEDEGCGVPPELQARIFDPFFTTKPVGKGTGLGLSVSYGIVSKHGGRFELVSAPGQGARFRVWLPVAGPTGEETA